MRKFSDVILLVEGSKVQVPLRISWFKKGKRNIRKDEYSNYLYSKALNFGLFYIAYCKKCDYYKWSVDFASALGILRIIKTR